jgi:hypothetical protein
MWQKLLLKKGIVVERSQCRNYSWILEGVVTFLNAGFDVSFLADFVAENLTFVTDGIGEIRVNALIILSSTVAELHHADDENQAITTIVLEMSSDKFRE